MSVLAITDHDSTEGLAEAMDEAARHGIEIVPGLEINCDVPGAEIHVLGYCVDWRAPWFQEFLREQRAERVARVHRIVERLAELGMPIDGGRGVRRLQGGLAGPAARGPGDGQARLREVGARGVRPVSARRRPRQRPAAAAHARWTRCA